MGQIRFSLSLKKLLKDNIYIDINCILPLNHGSS